MKSQRIAKKTKAVREPGVLNDSITILVPTRGVFNIPNSKMEEDNKFLAKHKQQICEETGTTKKRLIALTVYEYLAEHPYLMFIKGAEDWRKGTIKNILDIMPEVNLDISLFKLFKQFNVLQPHNEAMWQKLNRGKNAMMEILVMIQ